MTPWSTIRAFLRLFAVQGSWNYRTNTGAGFAYALLPLLRRIHAGDPAGLARALDRHVDHFNAHPYLTGIALGAVARMETDGATPEEVDRFKSVVRGPLGGLGDRLVWALWLPATALVGLATGFLSSNPVWGVAAFLIPYNVAHLTLRLWAFRAGLASGQAVLPRLQRADLSGWSNRLLPLLALACGLAVGALSIVAPPSPPPLGAAILAALAFGLGARWRTALWRPALLVFSLGVVMACLLGMRA